MDGTWPGPLKLSVLLHDMAMDGMAHGDVLGNRSRLSLLSFSMGPRPLFLQTWPGRDGRSGGKVKPLPQCKRLTDD